MNNHRVHPSMGAPVSQMALAGFLPAFDTTAIIQVALWAVLLGLVLAAALEGRNDG